MNTSNFTAIGNSIVGILRETGSIKPVIQYLEEQEIFKNQAASEADMSRYQYAIHYRIWEQITGISIENTSFLPNIKDGQIYVHYMDNFDYCDRYVYISVEPENVAARPLEPYFVLPLSEEELGEALE